MQAIVNEPIKIKLKAQTGLTDVTLRIYNNSYSLISTIPMTEPLPTIYSAEFIPPAIGQYTGIIQSTTADKQEPFDLVVVEKESSQETVNEIIRNTNLIPAIV